MKNGVTKQGNDGVGLRVALARQRLRPKLSRRMLAERLNSFAVVLDQGGVGDIENGRRRVTYLEMVALAEILGVSLHWLISGREE